MRLDELGRVRPVGGAGDVVGRRWRETMDGRVRHQMNQQAIGDVFPNGMQIARHIINEDDGKGAAGMQCVNDRPFRLFGGKQRKQQAHPVEQPTALVLEARLHGCQEKDVGLFRKSVERFDHAVERRLPQLLGLEEFLDQLG